MIECFAYRKGGCRILKINKCQGESCSFFKTKNQIEEDQKKVFKRIKSLDSFTQRHIIDLYYRGNMSLLDDVEVD